MKDSYYFSHDSNARNDPKILDMISRYGIVSYAWYWILIEMMREQKDFRLKLCKCNAYAMPTQCDENAIEKYIKDQKQTKHSETIFERAKERRLYDAGYEDPHSPPYLHHYR